mmetsp:Transcript_87851/g.209942  ORF Transcript_87851/g.209942 Transcript_87851/m.209942 type:complete len:265 (-) Transcript_87851:535-1329(-)
MPAWPIPKGQLEDPRCPFHKHVVLLISKQSEACVKEKHVRGIRVHERGEKGDPIFAQDEPALLEPSSPCKLEAEIATKTKQRAALSTPVHEVVLGCLVPSDEAAPLLVRLRGVEVSCHAQRQEVADVQITQAVFTAEQERKLLPHLLCLCLALEVQDGLRWDERNLCQSSHQQCSEDPDREREEQGDQRLQHGEQVRSICHQGHKHKRLAYGRPQRLGEQPGRPQQESPEQEGSDSTAGNTYHSPEGVGTGSDRLSVRSAPASG